MVNDMVRIENAGRDRRDGIEEVVYIYILFALTVDLWYRTMRMALVSDAATSESTSTLDATSQPGDICGVAAEPTLS